jgi:hypothetical protein
MIIAPAFTGATTTILWTPAVAADPDARVELAGYAGSGHGGFSLRLFQCASPDTGSLTIGPMISAELAEASDGFGYAGLSRFHETAHLATGYDVRFRIATRRSIQFGE